LVNNAGITRDGLLFRMGEGDWNDVISTNLSSCYHWTKPIARPMTRARWGRIVNITSVSGILGNAGQANYSAAKAGMIGLTKALAREFAGRNITVNAVAPGAILTDLLKRVIDSAPDPAVAQQEFAALNVARRLGQPREVADAVSYLMSDGSSFINGAILPVDSGAGARVYPFPHHSSVPATLPLEPRGVE
jgi:3-oxoacyl-[acyl-carrier protein] reductase